jgi:formate hydrogenlyase transcriptional activator
MSADLPALSKLIPFAVREAFSEPEQLLTAYFHESTVGLGIFDTEFRFLAINLALAQMNGIPPAAHLGKPCREVLKDFADKVEPELRRILAGEPPVVGLELSGLLPTRNEIGHWIANYFPIQDTDGRVKQIGVVVVEITEQKKLEESLVRLTARLQREKDRLQVLREIDTTLASNADIQRLFPAIVACIEKVIPYDLAGTWLYDRKDQVMRTAALDSRVGEVFREGEATPVAECMLGQSMLAEASKTFNHAELMTIPFPGARKLLEHGIKSVCSVPLITPKGSLGALGLGGRDDQAFSREDVALLSHAASSIALGLENALTNQALQQEKDRLQALREIDAALVAHLDLDKLLPAVSECLRRSVPHDYIGIHLYDESANVLRDYAPRCEITEKILPEDGVLPLDGSLAGQAFVERKTKVVNYAELANVPYAVAQRAIAQGVRSICFVPLITGKGTLGVLVLSSGNDLAFQREGVELLESGAAAIAQAVGNALAHRDLQQKKARLQALRDIDDILLSSLDLRQVLPAVSECLRRALPHDHVGICVYDERAKGLRDYAATSEIKRGVYPANGVLPLDGSLTGRHFVEGKSRVYDHAELVNVTFPQTRRALEAGILSSCFVPLATAKGRVGILTLSSHKDNAFRQEDLEFLEQVAAALAQTLQNALAHKALQEEKKRLQVLLNVSTALATNWNVQETFSTISAYLRRVLRQEYAAFLLLDKKSGLLVRQALDFPLGKGLCSALDVSAADGPEGMVLRERRSLTFPKEEMQRFHVEIADCLLAEGMRSLCSVPLLRPKGPLGVISLASTRADAFKPDDLALLNQVAAQLAVALENRRVSLEIETLKERLSAERKYLEGEIRTEPHFEEIIGQSPALKQTLRQVETVAGSDATVLILGETGTGKELIARAIHRSSGRRERAFIKLNCAAIPSGLLESELFGHERGAFTGAVTQKVGRLQLADRGTLFLDEIGEIPLELQPKLLRVLQDQEFERLGGTRTIKVDLRLISATNRDLAKSVSEGEFRSDLFYRLNVFPIRVPSLQERREDIPLLVRYFVRKYAARMARTIESIPNETMNALMEWPWPGNIRELENFIERCVILSQGPVLLAPPEELRGATGNATSADHTLENAEREHIISVLRESGGVISGAAGAANRLGLKRTTLQSMMHRLGIGREEYSGRSPKNPK